MLKTRSEPSLFKQVPHDISFHYPQSLDDFEASLARMASGLEVRTGYPDHILELDDVFLSPGVSTSCLYDSRGFRIPESCVRRGEDLEDYVGADQIRITPPTDYATVSRPVLYLSMFFRHWGHFLTESTSRLWARSAHPELSGLDVCFAGFAQGFKRVANAESFLASVAAPPRLLPARGVARIAKCFVPAPSFVNRAAAHVGHLTATREVAATLLPRERPRLSARPVYLSRSRLANVDRAIVNEKEFEAVLARGGVRIAHPQDMSLREQIVLFNTHAVLLGCAGSALHNLMFALAGREITTYILSEGAPNRNCLMIDAIVGNASRYLCVLRSAATTDPTSTARRLEIDIDATTEYLVSSGVLPRLG
jgi:capsular polysaccharide biosynthesis protein